MSSNLNVDFKPDPTQEVGMSWHDKKALFEQEAANLTTDPNAITKAEKQFKLHEEGVAGWNTKGAH